MERQKNISGGRQPRGQSKGCQHNRKDIAPTQAENKTAFIKVRCTPDEKVRIQNRAKGTGRSFSEYCREILLKGEVIAIPQMSDNEREAIDLLQYISRSFARLGSLIKEKDPAWVSIVHALSFISKEAFKRFFIPQSHVDKRVFKYLKMMNDDSEV